MGITLAPVRIFLFVVLLGMQIPAYTQVQPGATNKCERLLHVKKLREQAIQLLIPEYPPVAIKTGVTGIVVAEICIPAGISHPEVSIVSAPSSHLADAVKGALQKSTFRRLLEHGSYRAYGGKMFFYFVSSQEAWKVFEPHDTFYVGPRFAIAQQSIQSH
jgi:hypothetical protein